VLTRFVCTTISSSFVSGPHRTRFIATPHRPGFIPTAHLSIFVPAAHLPIFVAATHPPIFVAAPHRARFIASTHLSVLVAVAEGSLLARAAMLTRVTSAGEYGVGRQHKRVVVLLIGAKHARRIARRSSRNRNASPSSRVMAPARHSDDHDHCTQRFEPHGDGASL
jgi:hypothetical protein